MWHPEITRQSSGCLEPKQSYVWMFDSMLWIFCQSNLRVTVPQFPLKQKPVRLPGKVCMLTFKRGIKWITNNWVACSPGKHNNETCLNMLLFWLNSHTLKMLCDFPLLAMHVHWVLQCQKDPSWIVKRLKLKSQQPTLCSNGSPVCSHGISSLHFEPVIGAFFANPGLSTGRTTEQNLR